MINLTPSLLVGKGLHRECYVHPENENLCVKVVVAQRASAAKEEAREQAYCRLLEKRGISWTVLPRFHGTVETNLGTGAVFDLIRDFDGSVSRTLEHYLSSQEQTERIQPGLAVALRHLRETLLRERIVTMTIKPKNIVYKRVTEHDGALIVIDNIGNSDVLPWATYIGFLGVRKIRRKWNRFESRLPVEYPDNALLRRALADARV